MKAISITVVCTILAMSGCCKGPMMAPAVLTAAAPAPIAPAHSLKVNVVADGIQFQPEAAKVDGNVIVSTGGAGFLMYGPYVAFAPGTYRVAIEGEIPPHESASKIRFDSVSHGATQTHGSLILNTSVPLQGTIAEFNITIEEMVTDLEVRAEATAGGKVRIASYQISQVN